MPVTPVPLNPDYVATLRKVKLPSPVPFHAVWEDGHRKTELTGHTYGQWILARKTTGVKPVWNVSLAGVTPPGNPLPYECSFTYSKAAGLMMIRSLVHLFAPLGGFPLPPGESYNPLEILTPVARSVLQDNVLYWRFAPGASPRAVPSLSLGEAPLRKRAAMEVRTDHQSWARIGEDHIRDHRPEAFVLAPGDLIPDFDPRGEGELGIVWHKRTAWRMSKGDYDAIIMLAV